jgi:hypothetical protein
MGRKQINKEVSTNSISRARARMMVDSKGGFRSSNMAYHNTMHPDESMNVSVESFMKPHREIDSSQAIFSAQKVREINYKNRKRKVDTERELKKEQEPKNQM